MVTPGVWIGRGWRQVTAAGQFWNYLLLALLFKLVESAAASVGVGIMLLAGPLTAAVYAIILRHGREGHFAFDEWQRVKERFVPLMVAGLVIWLMGAAAVGVVLVVFLLPIVAVAMITATADELGGAVFGAMVGVAALAAAVAGMAVATLYRFSFLLILERKLEFWEAMETSRRRVQANFGRFFFFSLGLVGVHLLGLLACGVGVLVAMPVAWCAVAGAYRDLWPDEEAGAAEEETSFINS